MDGSCVLSALHCVDRQGTADGCGDDVPLSRLRYSSAAAQRSSGTLLQLLVRNICLELDGDISRLSVA